MIGVAHGLDDAVVFDAEMAGLASIIPVLPARPTVTPIVTTIDAEGPYTVAAGTIIYSETLGALFGSQGFSDYLGPFTNNGTVWSEITDDSDRTLSMIGRYNHIRVVDNNGLMVIHAGSATIRNIFGFQETTVSNSGQIFVINEGGANAWLSRSSLGGPVVNSGTIAVQALHGYATGYEFLNSATFDNRSGGSLLVEGMGATAFYIGRGERSEPVQINNSGTIIARSLDPGQLSFGFILSGLTGERFSLTNSGVIAADVAIFGSDDGATVSQLPIQNIHNLAGGEIYGLIYLQRGNDTLDNGGAIYGDVYMGEGNDTVDTEEGAIEGITDLGWGNDVYRGSVSQDYVAGARGDDQLYGNGGADLLMGGGGDDVLIGGAGNDGLFGEWGDDRIVMLDGDYVDGGAGNDRIELGDYSFEYVTGGEGFDTLVLPGGARILNLHLALAEGALADIEQIELGGNNVLRVQSNDVALLTGGEASLRLITSSGDRVELVGSWTHGVDQLIDGATWQSWSKDGATILVRGAATVVSGAVAGTDGALDAVAGGTLAPLPTPDWLDFTSPVEHLNGYEITQTTAIEAHETWQSSDGAPVVTIYSSRITLTNDGTIQSFREAGSDARSPAFAVSAPNVDLIVNNGSITVDNQSSNSLSSSAFALSTGYFSAVENHGQIIARTALNTAEAVRASWLYNHGNLSAHSDGGSAFGVRMNGRVFENYGQITASSGGLEPGSFYTMYGLPLAVGAWLRDGTHLNAGTISASGVAVTNPDEPIPTFGSAAVAYDLVGDATLTNSGTLSGGLALLVRQDSVASVFHFINGGQAQGSVLFVGQAADRIDNSGRIDGGVQLGGGADVFDGAAGVQTGLVDGQEGNDRLTGGRGVDWLSGGSGDDILDGGAGADNMYGGAGNDTFYVDRQNDIVFEFASEGTDTVTSSANYYLYANIENLTLTGSGNLFGVGNELANTLTGNAGSNLLLGGAGNDVVRGGAGVDSLFGESGADQLFGDAGIDYLVGGIGNDTLDGGADADSLYGEDGDDVLIGGTGFHTDILVGGVGNDTLRGNSGLGDYDLMDGGAGNDSYYVDTPDDLTFEAAGGGTDTVYATINGAGYYLYANVENLVLGGNTPFGVGNALDNRITGSAAANWLLGGGGNDVLDGGAGNDVLFGEAGADIFVFQAGTGGDVIGDFVAGTDRIDLSAFGFTSFAQVQALMGENGGTSFIALGGADFIVLNGVARASLSAGDFILASAPAGTSQALGGGDRVDATPDWVAAGFAGVEWPAGGERAHGWLPMPLEL